MKGNQKKRLISVLLCLMISPAALSENAVQTVTCSKAQDSLPNVPGELISAAKISNSLNSCYSAKNATRSKQQKSRELLTSSR